MPLHLGQQKVAKIDEISPNLVTLVEAIQNLQNIMYIWSKNE